MRFIARLVVEYDADAVQHCGKNKLAEEEKFLKGYLDDTWPGGSKKFVKFSLARKGKTNK